MDRGKTTALSPVRSTALLGAHLSWTTTTLPQSREVTSTMHKSKKINAISCDLVYESIASDEELSNILGIDFWYDPATLGKGPQRSGGCPCFSDERCSVEVRISADERR